MTPLRRGFLVWAVIMVAMILTVALTSCVDTLADAILGDNGPPGRVDTLTVVTPPDTVVLYCTWKHGHRECHR